MNCGRVSDCVLDELEKGVGKVRVGSGGGRGGRRKEGWGLEFDCGHEVCTW